MLESFDSMGSSILKVMEPLSRKQKVLLWGLLISSFTFRLWFAGDGLNSLRFFDERFSFHNVAAFLRHQTFTPANAFYPSLSWAPQAMLLALVQQVHEWTGIEWLSIWGQGEVWSPTAYGVARAVSALWGTLSLWALFRVGRRLFDPNVGLLAAALLAFVPRQLLSSAHFKPDILVLFLSILALDIALGAVEKPTLRAYLLSGVVIGMAVSAKYTGVVAAIPLALGTLVDRPLAWLRWKRLLQAALASLLTFIVLNPWVGRIGDFLPELWSIYQTKGEESGESHFSVFLAILRFLAEHHTPWILGLSIVGALSLLVLMRHGPPKERVQFLMILGTPVVIAVGYAAVTKLLKAQNVLPLCAFVALWAAWGALATLRAQRFRYPWLGSGIVTLILAILLFGVAWQPGVAMAYEQRVPSTLELSRNFLIDGLKPLHRRFLLLSTLEKPLVVFQGNERVAGWQVDYGELPGDVPDLADAELYLEHRDALALKARINSETRGEISTFHPRFFRAQGPPVTVLLHPWSLIEANQGFKEALPNGWVLDIPKAGIYSLGVELRLKKNSPKPRALIIGRRDHRDSFQEMPLFITKGDRGVRHFLTPRWRQEAGEVNLALESSVHFRGEVQFNLYRWEQSVLPSK